MKASRAIHPFHLFLVLGLGQVVLAQHSHGGSAQPPADMDELQRVVCVPPKEMTMADMEDFPEFPSYFSHPEHSGLLYAHVLLMILSWVVALPVAVMLSIARSKWTPPVQLAFASLNSVGLFVGTVYNTQTPDLYENNAHHKLGWAITWITAIWILLGVFSLHARRDGKGYKERPQIQPVTRQAVAEYQRLTSVRDQDHYRWSSDSGQGTERNTDSLCHSSRTPSINSVENVLPTQRHFDNEDNNYEDVDLEKHGFLGTGRVNRFLARYVPRIATGRTLTVIDVVYVVIERFSIMLGFLAMMTGVVTYAGIFRGGHIFNGMAHFVKGGIFFWYGLLTFGRWMGCFAEFGWAWNIKPGADIIGRRKARIPSAEFTESFVIFLYGASNVFMEHLAAWGQAWTAMDLEHVSITIMFFGGGLLGMLIESSRVRKLLNSALTFEESGDGSDPEWEQPKSYKHSLNPLPALVILLLGIMMSSHTQHSVVSGKIHKQWGTLFVGFALARGVTYITFWLKPPKSYIPTRPPSEIIASFCLVSGGAIFMASNKDTVWALEQFKLDAMFVFTVVMGLTALLMAWVVVVLTIKGIAIRKHPRLKRPYSFHTSA